MYKAFFLLLQCVILSFISEEVSGAPLAPKMAKITISYEGGSRAAEAKLIRFPIYCAGFDPQKGENDSITVKINNFNHLPEDEKCIVVYTDFECKNELEIIRENIRRYNSSVKIHSVQMCSTHLLNRILNVSRSEGYKSFLKEIEALKSANSTEVYHERYSTTVNKIFLPKPTSTRPSTESTININKNSTSQPGMRKTQHYDTLH